MSSKNDYIEQLEDVIKQMLRPLKNIPLNVVIEALCEKKIIPFDKSNPRDKKLLEKLEAACIVAGKEVNKVGIMRARANEVGNDIEPFVKRAFGLPPENRSTLNERLL